MLNTILADLRLALRSLRLRPALSLTLLLTFAIGAAAAVTIFTLVHAVLLRPFPFLEPERLVEIQTVSTKAEGNVYGTSFPDAEDLGERVEAFASVGSFRESRINLVPDDRAIPARVAHVTSGFFDVFGTPPLLGRAFAPAEDVPGGDSRKAVLSYSAWQSLFGGRGDILGQAIRTAMGEFIVIGVMPRDIVYPPRTDLWVPLQSHFDIRGLDRASPRQRSARLWYRSLARLSDEAELEQSRAEVESVSANLRTEHPETNGDFSHQVVTLRQAEAGSFRPYLLLLLGAAFLVACVCSVNVAALLVSRTTHRSGELGLRAALGAGGRRLAQQLLTESGVLGLIGGVLGVGVAVLGIKLYADGGWLSTDLLPAWVRLETDPVVVIAALLVALASGLLAGLGPLIFVFGRGAVRTANLSARGSRRSAPLSAALVVAEVGLSMMLLVGAALLLSSFAKLRQVETGLDTERVLTVSMSAYRPGTNEERIRAVTSFYRQVIEKVEELPGVVAVGGSDNFPYGSRFSSARNEMRVEVRGESEEEQAHRAGALLVDVTPDYFQAVGVPLLAGRTFTEGDTLDAPYVIILSETAAKTLFPGREALGQEARIAYEGGGADAWARVVGIVGDVKYGKRESGGGIELYYPYTQYGLASTTLAIRMRGPTAGFEDRLREIVQGVDPETAVEQIRTLGALVDDSLQRDRFWGTLIAGCAVMALLLASIGIYGIVSFGVANRTREIGIRMALGSTPSRVLLQVTQGGMRLVFAGILLGIVGAVLMTPLLTSYLFGTSRLDFVAYVIPAAVLGLTGLLAGLRPSLRAARVEPVRALSRE